MGSARVNMLRSMGLDENNLGDGRTGFIMSGEGKVHDAPGNTDSEPQHL